MGPLEILVQIKDTKEEGWTVPFQELSDYVQMQLEYDGNFTVEEVLIKDRRGKSYIALYSKGRSL